jgi:hypothetical protein
MASTPVGKISEGATQMHGGDERDNRLFTGQPQPESALGTGNSEVHPLRPNLSLALLCRELRIQTNNEHAKFLE